MLDTVYVVRELPGRHFLSTTTIQPIASAVSAPSTKSTSLGGWKSPFLSSPYSLAGTYLPAPQSKSSQQNPRKSSVVIRSTRVEGREERRESR